MGVQNLILPYNFLNRGFSPKFFIFGRQFSDNKKISWQLPDSRKFRRELSLPALLPITTPLLLYIRGLGWISTIGGTWKNKFQECFNLQKAKVLLPQTRNLAVVRKANRTTNIQSPASHFQSQKGSDFSEVTQFHARYVNGTLLSKAVTRDHLAKRYKQLQT